MKLNETVLEKATNKDSEALTYLMRRSKAHWGYSSEQLKTWEDELTVTEEFTKSKHVNKLLIEGVIAGYYAYSLEPDNNAKLESLFVDPSFIGNGIGKLLMNHFFECISRQSASRVWLESDPNAMNFYLKFGFEVVGKKSTTIKNRYMPIMSKELKQKHLFETSRTIVRSLYEHDFEGFYDMQSNENVMRYIKPKMNLEESKRELERFIDASKNEDQFYKIWAIESKANGEFLGICGVYENDKNEFEIAYRFREVYWGQGYGSEIADGLIKYCFEKLGIEKLTAYVLPGNKGSVKILEDRMAYLGEEVTMDGVEKKFELTQQNYV